MEGELEKNLKELNETLLLLDNELKDIEYFLSRGTLLGIIRQGSLNAWDDDIDIGINGFCPAKIKERLINIVENGSGANYTMVKNYKNLKPVGIKFWYEKYRTIFESRNEQCYPFEIVYPLREVEYLGRKFRVPNQSEVILEMWYGDWEVPSRKTFIYKNTTELVNSPMAYRMQNVQEVYAECNNKGEIIEPVKITGYTGRVG